MVSLCQKMPFPGTGRGDSCSSPSQHLCWSPNSSAILTALQSLSLPEGAQHRAQNLILWLPHRSERKTGEGEMCCWQQFQPLQRDWKAPRQPHTPTRAVISTQGLILTPRSQRVWGQGSAQKMMLNRENVQSPTSP